MRLTIACPELMRDDANNLAMAKEGEGGGFSPSCYSRAVNRAYCLNLKGNENGNYSIY